MQVDEKSNEWERGGHKLPSKDHKSSQITALPVLLDMLDIRGCIITIDAMGCQKKVAKKIIDRGVGYVLALKDNQGNLYDLAKDYLDEMGVEVMLEPGGAGDNYYETEEEKGHGRVEVRRCWACENLEEWLPSLLDSYNEWAGLRSIVAVECERTEGGETTVFRRYFISSLGADARAILAAVRSH